jgi:hypothetical protein
MSTLPLVEGGDALVAVEAGPGRVRVWRGRAVCIWRRPGAQALREAGRAAPAPSPHRIVSQPLIHL